MIKPQPLVLAALALLCAPAWAQVYRCPDASGRTVIQQMPCAGGKEMNVRPASGRGSTAVAAPKPAASAPAPTPAAAPPAPAPVQQAAAPQLSPLDREAAMCLDWYRPMLYNPRDAYFSKPSKEGRVVKLRLHGTNVYGGVITKEASCEINNGKLDDDWTQVHADRLGWGKKQK